MNPKKFPLGSVSFFLTAFLCFFFSPGASAQLQQDSYDDGNDDGWDRFSPLDIVGASSIFTFPDYQGGGHGYRLQSPAPPVADAGPARSFSLLPQVYTDFYASVDVVDWNNEVDQAFGIILRTDNVGLGQTTGYVMNYNPQQSSGARGQAQFNIVTGESDAGVIGAADISLEPGHDYRFVMSAEGDMFRAWIFDHLDLTAPLVSYFGVNDLYPQGKTGLFNFYPGADMTDPDLGIADTTFDRFWSTSELPESLDGKTRTSPWFGTPTVPCMTSISPSNRGTYAPASDGLHFSLLLPEGMAQAPQIQFTLNGIDRTSGLEWSHEGQTMEASYKGLEANRVYDAVVEFPGNTPGSRTDWTFDTFEQSHLTSGESFVIEAEDYNFDGGQYINNPDPSGIKESGQAVNSANGYLDQEGIPEVDFFDYETNPGPEELAALRAFDPVRTQAGSSESGSDEQFSGPDPAVNDVTRAVYAAVDLPEYQVTDTEGGEWLNYTRDFPEGEYHVYLRAAGRATQEIHLDEVTSDPSQFDQTTRRLGTFDLPNMGVKFNYRFVALKDDQKANVRLTLDGVKTLRLTIGDEREDRLNDTTALNYLLFTPAIEDQAIEPALTVLASSTLDGVYEPAGDAVVEADQIMIPVSSDMQFFKINVSTAQALTFVLQGISVQDGHLIIQYTQ